MATGAVAIAASKATATADGINVTFPFLWSTATGKAILAGGVGIYLVGLVFTLVELRQVYGDVPHPRPAHTLARRLGYRWC